MKAKIKEIYSLEIESLLKDYIPEEKDNFEIVIRLMIGTSDDNSMESFDITVCSSKRIMIMSKYEDAIWGKNLLIVERYDYIKIINIIKNRIESICGTDWDDLAIKISRLAAWEFEDYQTQSRFTQLS